MSDGDAQTNDSGRIIRDNIFGNLTEDAARRDFTANALYYNAATEEVLDFHNGVADLKNNLLRMIGDPTTRYQEDPVRMLRAVRLSAKLGLKIEKSTQEPIHQINAGLVQLRGHRNHVCITLGRQNFFFECRRQNTHAQRLAEYQHIAGFGARVFLDA